MAKQYEVGYRRPPKQSQFKPGQSGNPKGRPKIKQQLSEISASELLRKIPAQENGRPVKLGAFRAVIHRTTNDAIKGDAKARKLVMDLSERVTPLLQPAQSQDNNQLALRTKEPMRASLLKTRRWWTASANR